VRATDGRYITEAEVWYATANTTAYHAALRVASYWKYCEGPEVPLASRPDERSLALFQDYKAVYAGEMEGNAFLTKGAVAAALAYIIRFFNEFGGEPDNTEGDIELAIWPFAGSR
jgi:hypothetical protein